MSESVNMKIADRLTERQLRVMRVETSLRHQVFEHLRVLESDILSLVKSADPTQYALLIRRRREIERLMSEEVEPLVMLRYERLARELDNAMGRLASNEAEALQAIMNEATEDTTIADVPSDRQLRAGIAASVFPSVATSQDMATTGSDWWSRQATSLTQRLHDQMLVSVSLEESLVQLSQRITGTVENGHVDGIMSRARSDAARLLTTQTTNALGEARVATAQQNAQGLILQHQSILDSHTSIVCLSRHGLKYTADTHEGIGHSIPYLNGVPYHPS